MGLQTNLVSTAGRPEKHNNPLAMSNGRYIDDALRSLVEKTPVAATELDRFSQLRQNLLDWLCEQRQRSSNSDAGAGWSGWGWNPFISDADIRIGLLTVYKNKPIPIHDHPQAVGTLVVLDGVLSVNDFRLESVAKFGRLKSAELQKVAADNFSAGQSTEITPSKHNIHSLKSQSEACLVLDILLTPYDEAQRSWYLPVANEIPSGQPFAAFCLAQRPLA